MTSESTEVWVRNPELYIRECVELNQTNICWDAGFLVKRSITPERFGQLYFSPTTPWRMLVIGNSEQGAHEIVPGFSLARPKVTYPVWMYGEPLERLEELLLMAPERIILTQMPSVTDSVGKKFLRTLSDLQEENPDVILHLHGLYSYRYMFGLHFRAADTEPRTYAQKGKVVFGNGKVLTYEQAQRHPKWITLMNMRPKDLEVPRNRCMFNIRTAHWAARHFKEEIRFSLARNLPDPYASDADFKPPESKQIMLKKQLVIEAQDKFLCDTCSLQLSCRYYREGAVCAVPDSEPSELARYFKTRDSDTIIEGLGTLLATQTRRLKTGLEGENIDGKLDPEVTKIIKSLFDSGVKLAKLVDPRLAAAGAPKVGISFNTQNNTAITAANPQALMAAIVAELEGRGIPRDQITPEMVQELMAQPEDQRKRSIETHAIEASSD